VPNKIYLKPGKESIVLRGHPWIFSGAMVSPDITIQEGSVVEVYSFKEEFICLAHYQDASIALRVLSYQKEVIDQSFYISKLRQALSLRKEIIHDGQTNAFRLIHGEGDGLPGLIIDKYDKHIILELHSKGMYKDRYLIAVAAHALFSDLKTIYASVPSIMKENPTVHSEFIQGNDSETVILENGHKFIVNWTSGQKTGFFLDQRENRALLGSLAAGKSVLNLFSYSGGFSVYALAKKAKFVKSVDISAKATTLCKRNSELNDISDHNHSISQQDIMKDPISDQLYDIVVVDPPAFAKNIKKRHKAVQAYKRLNQKALKLLKPNGLLMTFSCSQVVSVRLFTDTIRAAFIATHTQGQVLQHLEQGKDHPVSITHEEGHYLKGLLIRKL